MSDDDTRTEPDEATQAEDEREATQGTRRPIPSHG